MSTSAPDKCKHGYDCSTETVVDDDERTACCGAFYTFSGDGDPYCKCCFGAVVGGDDVVGISVDLSELEQL